MDVSGLAFVLHRRAYQNSGAIVSFLTQSIGRVDAVAKGVTVKAGKSRFHLAPFYPLHIHAKGRHDLLNLHGSEASQTCDAPWQLAGHALFCGLYVNELLYFLLPKHEHNEAVFQLYRTTVQALSHTQDLSDLEQVLRTFEQHLLNELGYGIHYCNAQTGEALDADAHYIYRLGEGFVPALVGGVQQARYKGEVLLQIAQNNYAEQPLRMAAKQLMRQVIQSHLGGKTLKSRELFTA